MQFVPFRCSIWAGMYHNDFQWDLAVRNFERLPPDMREILGDAGMCAIGGPINESTLAAAYSRGIFPWPDRPEDPVYWFSPDPRALIEFEHLHVSRSLRRLLRRQTFDIRHNTAFERVVRLCGEIRTREGEGTWVTEELVQGYCQLHRSGYAYSYEAWLENRLVGGLFGVRFGHYASAESMFHLRSNASKMLLATLMQDLQSDGLSWLDVQVMSPVVGSFGGREVSRSEFLEKLARVFETPPLLKLI